MASTQADDLGTVLVIGGCGFLGSLLVGMLVEEPSVSSVHVISRNPTENLNPKAKYHAGDISHRFVNAFYLIPTILRLPSQSGNH